MNPAVTNVFFTQGQLDPWRPMGLQEDLNEHSPTVVIPSNYLLKKLYQRLLTNSLNNSISVASHVADMGSISDRDSPEMVAAKERVFELIKQWVS